MHRLVTHTRVNKGSDHAGRPFSDDPRRTSLLFFRINVTGTLRNDAHSTYVHQRADFTRYDFRWAVCACVCGCCGERWARFAQCIESFVKRVWKELVPIILVELVGEII